MKKKWYLRWWAFLIYFLVFVVVVRAFSSSDQVPDQPPVAPITAPVPTKTPEVTDDLYQVVKVIDGDTITVEKSGANETLRLIGINTPETVDPRKPVECFGQEASNKAKELLSDKQVRLEADPSQGERDKYGRLLRYVFLADGTFYNKVMIQQGYAYEYTYDLPYKYQAGFKQAEQESRDAKRGLWADGACGGAPVSPAKTDDGQSTSDSQQNQYICSYNAYNCANFTSQTEAQSAFEVCGGPANDPHQLDGDHDGRVCESLP